MTTPTPQDPTATTAGLTQPPVAADIPMSPATPASWGRLFRQLCFIPFLHNRWLTPIARTQLTQAVTAAEVGHRGEVFLIVENHLPLAHAHQQNCHQRAIDLFGLYRVWDTAENTGVLVYLNLCERQLEIIADRGINSHVAPSVWQALCEKAIEGIKHDRPAESLQTLLQEIGYLLRQHYQLVPASDVPNDPNGNELADDMVYLR